MVRVLNIHRFKPTMDDLFSNRLVYIGRGTPYGNPFIIGRDGDREEVIKKYEERLRNDGELIALVQTRLRGKDLVCYCSPLPCHGDILAQIANEGVS